MLVQQSGDVVFSDSRLVLRLWAADVEVTDGQTAPLWIGSVAEERLYHPLGLVTLVSTRSDVDAPRKALAEALDARRLVSRAKGVDGLGLGRAGAIGSPRRHAEMISEKSQITRSIDPYHVSVQSASCRPRQRDVRENDSLNDVLRNDVSISGAFRAMRRLRGGLRHIICLGSATVYLSHAPNPP
ncbi:hypothetical protein ACVOMV_26060 (plasmid) [Mesorhizobium atlanticum]|uniref:hypothetical protein n=1 Tax=Mesorhizobium atlanticum TaxID=2233532 RepID=UPI00370451E3